MEIRWAPSLHVEGGLASGMWSPPWSRARCRASRHRSRGPPHRGGAAHSIPDEKRHGRRVRPTSAPTASIGFDFAGLEQRYPTRAFGPPSPWPVMAAWGSPAMPASGAVPSQVRSALALEPWRIAHGAAGGRRPAAHGRAHRARRHAGPVPHQQPPGRHRQSVGDHPCARLHRAGVPVTPVHRRPHGQRPDPGPGVRQRRGRLGLTPASCGPSTGMRWRWRSCTTRSGCGAALAGFEAFAGREPAARRAA